MTVFRNNLVLIEQPYGIRPEQIKQLNDNWFKASAIFIPDTKLNPGLYFFIIKIDWSFSDNINCNLTTTFPSIAFNLR